ncbi:MAG: hypothetical protein ACREUX_14050, partial [Burkholderiales bacterium]
GHYAQAATLYEATLDQALIEDKPEPIIDARFNLALAQTYVGRYQSALDLVTLAEAERIRRMLGPDPELQLLRATIHYRAGDAAAAQRVLDPLLGDPALSPPTAAKAQFLAGVMAAERSDASALRRHRDALPAGDARVEQADRLELDGRLAAIEGEADEALRRLDRAALLRSQDGDYRGMARVLVVAGTVAERAGRTELAGGYWLRAGRSGAQRGEPDAREWLEHARALGERTGDAALILETEAMLTELGAAQRPQ